MPNPNISVDLTDAEITAILAKIDEVKALMPFLINLTPQQRKKLFKMGPKSVSYVQLALQVAQQHPEIMPSGFSSAEFEKDVKLAEGLTQINVDLLPFVEGVSDTLMLGGVEAINQSNQVYELVKSAAKRDGTYDSIRQQLGERYKQAGSPKPATPTA